MTPPIWVDEWDKKRRSPFWLRRWFLFRVCWQHGRISKYACSRCQRVRYQ